MLTNAGFSTISQKQCSSQICIISSFVIFFTLCDMGMAAGPEWHQGAMVAEW